MSKKVLLTILDGWGLATDPARSAIDQAHTPCIDLLYQQYPHSQLAASEQAVGLPVGQAGNSEVGHMHLGAGRIVAQPLSRINNTIDSGAFYQNPTLLAAFAYAKAHQKAVHLMGLVSDGGVHAHLDHLKALCKAAQDHAVPHLFVHAFTDGRDTAPQSALNFLADLEEHLQTTKGQLASVMGRYYAMDRNQHWARTQVAYNALVHGQGTLAKDWHQAIAQSYAQGTTDEFLLPIILTDVLGRPRACVQPGDVVVCFNFRTDRSRQITQVLTQNTPVATMPSLPLYYVTMTSYDDTLQGVKPLFPTQVLPNTLGEVLSAAGKKQLRIAETEKYPHVTYFFSGGREAPFPGETRILCPSPQVATYDLAPAMAAPTITQKALPLLANQEFDFICLNFANADMVGHTGVFDAAVEACQAVDRCLKQIVDKALQHDYLTLVVADHGNADQMKDSAGNPFTAHTTHPVPCIVVDSQAKGTLRSGSLADVAPTILECMGLPIPTVMQGTSLFKA